MSISVIILAVGVVGAFFLYNIVTALVIRFLPDKWFSKWIGKLCGLPVGFAFLYFAGYYIMDKETSSGMGLLVAVIPWVLNIGWKILSKEKLIEDQ